VDENMRFGRIFLLIALLSCFEALAAPVIIQRTGPLEDPLPLGSMNIVSTEHTAEYLEKSDFAQVGIGAFNASGYWTLELRDTSYRTVGMINLYLFQAGNLVFGTGTISAFENDQDAVTAYGTLLDGNSMNLAVVSLDTINLYRLSIANANTNTISGSFSAYSSKGRRSIIGTVYGEREITRALS
jgi:hypothetical protein